MSRQLPPNPSLKHLKNQAKALLKAHEAGDAEALQRLKAHLPRFSEVPDEELRAAEVTLKGCQHVIAREYGFESWNWLRAFVEIEFDLLLRLGNHEIQRLPVSWRDWAVALSSATDDAGDVHPCPEEIAEKVLHNLPERRHAFITEEIAVLGPLPVSEVKEMRQRILKSINGLAAQDRVDWPTGGGVVASRRFEHRAAVSPRLLELARRPMDTMSIDEIAEMWREMTTHARREAIQSLEQIDSQIADSLIQEGLRLAIFGTEPDLVADILETRSRSVLLPRLRMRGTMIIQGLLAIQVGDKGYIVRHKLGAIYQSETSALEDASGQVSVEDLVARLQETPLARMAFAQITVFFSDMSGLRRREGLASLRPLIEVAGHPLLRRGLAMICDQVDSAETRAVLEELQKEELGQIEARHRIVITGIPGMQRGGQPRCP